MRQAELFADYVMHDIRVQIQLLLGNADWLLRLADGGSILAGGKDVTESVLSMHQNAQLIYRLLDIMLENKGEENASLCVSDTLNRVMDIVAENIRAAGKICKCDIQQGLYAYASENKLERAVYNLISNAIRHGEGGECVAVDAWRDDMGVHIAVSNVGPSLGEHARYILSTDEELVACGSANGMGLRIVRLLTDSMNGSISVERKGERNIVTLNYLPAPA